MALCHWLTVMNNVGLMRISRTSWSCRTDQSINDRESTECCFIEYAPSDRGHVEVIRDCRHFLIHTKFSGWEREVGKYISVKSNSQFLLRWKQNADYRANFAHHYHVNSAHNTSHTAHDEAWHANWPHKVIVSIIKGMVVSTLEHQSMYVKRAKFGASVVQIHFVSVIWGRC